MSRTEGNRRVVTRALTEVEARALLERNRIGRIAYAFHDHVDVEPINYVPDGNWLYGRTSPGSKLTTLAHHPWCAFETDIVRGTFDWQSVVAKGQFIVFDPESDVAHEYEHALAAAKRLVPGAFSEDDPAPQRRILFGIHIQELSGRASESRERD